MKGFSKIFGKYKFLFIALAIIICVFLYFSTSNREGMEEAKQKIISMSQEAIDKTGGGDGGGSGGGASGGTNVKLEGFYKLDDLLKNDGFKEAWEDKDKTHNTNWNICANHGRCGGVSLQTLSDHVKGIYNTGCVYYVASGPEMVTSDDQNENKQGFKITHSFSSNDEPLFDKNMLNGISQYSEGKLSETTLPEGVVAFFSNETGECPKGNSKSSAKKNNSVSDMEDKPSTLTKSSMLTNSSMLSMESLILVMDKDGNRWPCNSVTKTCINPSIEYSEDNSFRFASTKNNASMGQPGMESDLLSE
jgi:hypothetical protein